MGLSLSAYDTQEVLYTSPTLTGFGETLEEAVKEGVDLTNLSGSNGGWQQHENLTLVNAKLKGANLYQNGFINCDFTGSTFEDVSRTNETNNSTVLPLFLNCFLDRVNFTNCIIKGTDSIFKGGDGNGNSFRNALFNKNLFWGNITFIEADLSNVVFSNYEVKIISGSEANKGFNFWGGTFHNTNFQFFDLTKFPIFFHNADLTGASFHGSKITTIGPVNPSLIPYYSVNVFHNCNLTSVDFSNCDFNGNFTFVKTNNLTNCNFQNADLSKVFITENLSGSNCNFKNANLTDIDFSKSILVNSDFENANFSQCNLFSSNLSGCNLQGADFRNVKNLDYVDFQFADLTDSVFNDDAKFGIIKLFNSNFTNVDLSNVNFVTKTSEGKDNADYEYQVACDISATNYSVLSTSEEDIRDEIKELTGLNSTLGTIQTKLIGATSDLEPYQDTLNKLFDIMVKELKARNRAYNLYVIIQPSLLTYFYKKKMLRLFLKNEIKYRFAKERYDDFNNDFVKPRKTIIQNFENDIANLNVEIGIIESSIKVPLAIYNDAKEKYSLSLEVVKDALANKQYYQDNPSIEETFYADLKNVNLTNADLHGRDLTKVDMRFTILDNTNLQGCTFKETKLYDADLTNKTLSDCDFSYAHLSGASFENLSVENLSFIYADLTYSTFTGGSLKKNNFLGGNLSGATIEDVIVGTSDGPNFTSATLVNAILRDLDFTGNKNLIKVNLSGADLTGTILDEVNLNGSILSNVLLNNISASNANFTECEMERVDLSNSVLTSSLFTGSNMIKAYFQNTQADFCYFDYVKLSASDMRDSNFTQTTFKYSNMIYADMRDSNFNSNNFSYADMSHVKTFKSNFRYPVLTGAIFSFLPRQKLNIFKVS